MKEQYIISKTVDEQIKVLQMLDKLVAQQSKTYRTNSVKHEQRL